jgi:hypothetical protein
MKISATTTLPELAFIVGNAMIEAGITAVLSGGGAATVYAPEAYQSRDLDFILGYWGSASEEPLLKLEFQRRNQMYIHAETTYTLEFPPGPLAVGSDQILTWNRLNLGDKKLDIISPTDCVRDRLSWFLFNSDFAALEQALSVAMAQEIDLEIIEDWCKREGQPQKFELFKARLKTA